eukprot:scaffold20531_cov67-Cyclotella_meneghiniana.AAC.4
MASPTTADEIGRISPTTGSLTFPLQPQLHQDPTSAGFIAASTSANFAPPSPTQPNVNTSDSSASAGQYSSNTTSAPTPWRPAARDYVRERIAPVSACLIPPSPQSSRWPIHNNQPEFIALPVAKHDVFSSSLGFHEPTWLQLMQSTSALDKK